MTEFEKQEILFELKSLQSVLTSAKGWEEIVTKGLTLNNSLIKKVESIKPIKEDED